MVNAKDILNFDSQKVFLASLLSFIALQVSFIFLFEIGLIREIKFGWVLFLFLAVVGIMSLLTIGKKIGQLDLKKDMPFIFVIFTVIAMAFMFLPDYLPQIFSSFSIEIGRVFKDSIGSMIKSSFSGVVSIIPLAIKLQEVNK